MNSSSAVTSRRSPVIRRFRELASSADARQSEGQFLCDGEKLLKEALRSDAEVQTVLWKHERPDIPGLPAFPEEYLLPEDLFDYVSPMKNSPGPLFSVKMKDNPPPPMPEHVLVLENVQDPGNVGTVLRSADAFGIDAVILLEGCADVCAPRTVRATMGAVFRQPVLRMSREQLSAYCGERRLRLLGAALSEKAERLGEVSLSHTAVCIGSEGRGLSPELLQLCETKLIIPMVGGAESLNAAVAASVLMWEMQREQF